jgi:ubiquitin-conjugating enzyme E2 H
MNIPGKVNKRQKADVMKLINSNYQVQFADESKLNGFDHEMILFLFIQFKNWLYFFFKDFNVTFYGPKETIYEDGEWNIHVILPNDYPYKSPSIGFNNRIYHPNVDEYSGTVCLDVINQTWTPMFDLINVFDVFLPQLLRYPNPADPLNGNAAQLLLKDEIKYNLKVKEYIHLYALKKCSPPSVVESRTSLANDSENSYENNTTTANSYSLEDMQEADSNEVNPDEWEVFSNVSEMSDL